MAIDVKKSEICIKVSDLSVTYTTPRGEVRALRNASLEVRDGETVGIAGESGCGKSTLANAIAGLLRKSAKVTSGRVSLHGEELTSLNESQWRRVRWKQVSVVPQSAMNNLSPVLRIGDQIADAILAHEHVSKREALNRAGDLLRMVHINPARVRSFPHELSGGMRQRVVIAMALALRPDLVILDEPTTALDVVVQAAILGQVKELQRNMGFSVIFITHDLPLLLQTTDRIVVMYAGQVVETASAKTFVHNARHPYSQLLMNSFPPLLGARRRAEGIAGTPPDLIVPPQGCAFADRCPKAMQKCNTQAPEVALFEDAVVHCHLYEGGTFDGRH